jgi:hypothetical protein
MPASERLHQVDLAGLLLGGEVAVQHARAADPRHGDRHAGLGDGVHRAGEERDRQADATGQPAAGVHLGRDDVRRTGDEQDVVVGQAERRELRRQLGDELIGLHRLPPPLRIGRHPPGRAGSRTRS